MDYKKAFEKLTAELKNKIRINADSFDTVQNVSALQIRQVTLKEIARLLDEIGKEE
jgi:hypothetical protein